MYGGTIKYSLIHQSFFSGRFRAVVTVEFENKQLCQHGGSVKKGRG